MMGTSAVKQESSLHLPALPLKQESRMGDGVGDRGGNQDRLGSDKLG